jgi:DNA-binding LytR/AlgR family response regulator
MYHFLLIRDQRLLGQLREMLGENSDELKVFTLEEIAQHLVHHSRRRLMVRRGTEYIALRMEEIVLFYTENKLVFTIDATGNKYLADRHLGDLEKELDEKTFFRANRQYIINVNFVRGYKPFERVKLAVDIVLPEFSRQVIVSQETAPVFRNWMLRA